MKIFALLECYASLIDSYRLSTQIIGAIFKDQAVWNSLALKVASQKSGVLIYIAAEA
jgi:hypothetical protein